MSDSLLLPLKPPGTANPISAQFAHAICGVDGVLHMLLLGKPPLYESSWAGKSGVITSHTNNMAGEISCLKGLQGAQGYPF